MIGFTPQKRSHDCSTLPLGLVLVLVMILLLAAGWHSHFRRWGAWDARQGLITGVFEKGLWVNALAWSAWNSAVPLVAGIAVALAGLAIDGRTNALVAVCNGAAAVCASSFSDVIGDPAPALMHLAAAVCFAATAWHFAGIRRGYWRVAHRVARVPLEVQLAVPVALGTATGSGLTVIGLVVVGLCVAAATALVLAMGHVVGGNAAQTLDKCKAGGVKIDGRYAGAAVMGALAAFELWRV